LIQFFEILESVPLPFGLTGYEGTAFIGILLMSNSTIYWGSILDTLSLGLPQNDQLHHFHLIYQAFSNDISILTYTDFHALIKESIIPFTDIHNSFLSTSFQECTINFIEELNNTILLSSTSIPLVENPILVLPHPLPLNEVLNPIVETGLPPTIMIITGLVIAGSIIKKTNILRFFYFSK
jgi:hypothetical protein